MIIGHVGIRSRLLSSLTIPGSGSSADAISEGRYSSYKSHFPGMLPRQQKAKGRRSFMLCALKSIRGDDCWT